MGDALHSSTARDRGLFRRDDVDKLLLEPNEHRTTLSASKLWQMGALEMWLQAHGI